MTSLTPEQAQALDASFKAQVKEDVDDLIRQWTLTPADLRPDPAKMPIANHGGIGQVAQKLASELTISKRRAQNVLYSGNRLPTSIVRRLQYVKAVEEILRTEYETLGSRFDRNYNVFAQPVDDAKDDVGGSPSGLQVLMPFEQWADVRMGAWLAGQPNHAHDDHVHHYSLIWRQDMLDYNTGDFYSIRRLAGWNATQGPSPWLVYRESSERTFTFAEAGVRAFDFVSRLPLAVDPERKLGEKAHTHAFRILFPRPVQPGEKFDVVYGIRLPGELEDLQNESEVMSISLERVQLRPVDRLVFNVAVSFEPRNVLAARQTESKHFIMCDGAQPEVALYEQTEWFEATDVLGLEWSPGTEPHIIRWETSRASDVMYVINFRGAGEANPLPQRRR